VVGILDHLAALYDWRVVFLILPMFYTFGWTYQVFLGRLKDSQSQLYENRHTERYPLELLPP